MQSAEMSYFEDSLHSPTHTLVLLFGRCVVAFEASVIRDVTFASFKNGYHVYMLILQAFEGQNLSANKRTQLLGA